MKLISTKTHGILDYLVGIILIMAPWILNFADNSYAQHIPVMLGIVILIVAIITNYEFGLLRAISMRTHLTLDFIIGLFLALSPWLFGFSSYVYLPHLIVGIIEMGMALVTSHKPIYTTNDKPLNAQG